MKNIYLSSVIVCLLLLVIQGYAQKRNVTVYYHEVTSPHLLNSSRGAAAACDTLNYQASQNWKAGTDQLDPLSGYATGTNSYNDLQKASYFDASSTTDNYISRVWIGVGIANSQNAANLTKVVAVSIYDGTSGKPGATPIATQSLQLNDFKAAASSNTFVDVFFNNVPLPASKKFFVAVDISNLHWNTDSLALLADSVGQSASPTGTAWEQHSDDNQWYSFHDVYQDLPNIDLYIFPFLSASTSGCGALPLKLLSFNVEKKDKALIAQWNVANEIEMRSYELQRSDDNLNFRTIASVAAINSADPHTYTATDKNIYAAGSNKISYRLKQISKDGAFTYSNVVVIDADQKGLNVTFANPFRNALEMQINSPAAQKLMLRVYDMQGKYTGINRQMNLSPGVNSIDLPNSASLPKGTYVVDILVNDSHLHYKVVKN